MTDIYFGALLKMHRKSVEQSRANAVPLREEVETRPGGVFVVYVQPSAQADDPSDEPAFSFECEVRPAGPPPKRPRTDPSAFEVRVVGLRYRVDEGLRCLAGYVNQWQVDHAPDDEDVSFSGEDEPFEPSHWIGERCNCEAGCDEPAEPPGAAPHIKRARMGEGLALDEVRAVVSTE